MNLHNLKSTLEVLHEDLADDLADPLGDDEDILPEDVVIVGADLAEAEFVDEADDESDNDHAFANRDI